MAALISARMRAFILKRLSVKLDRVFHYTDSTVAYFWCVAGQPGRWKQFVCNRVTEIRQHSDPEEWYHVPGPENIADFATRGVTAQELRDSERWWKGPCWLRDPEELRPCRRLRGTETADPTVVVEQRVVAALAATMPPIVDIGRFSDLEVALRVVGRVLLFVRRLRRLPDLSGPALRQSAEGLLVHWAQQEHFHAEIAATRRLERPSSKSPLASF